MLDKKDYFELETKKRKLVKKPSSLTGSDRLTKKAYEMTWNCGFIKICPDQSNEKVDRELVLCHP